MKEIIVIHTSDPDGSIFRSILGALQGKDVQILHAADHDPSALTLGDIEIFPAQRRVIKAGKEPLLHGPLPWACIQPGAALQCGLGRGL